MKKLTSLFRKLLFSNSYISRENLSYSIVIATIIFGASCQLSRKSQDDTQSKEVEGATLNVTPPLTPVVALADTSETERIDLFVRTNNKDTVLAQVLNPECGVQPTAVLNMEVSVESAFGQHKIRFAIRGDDSTETVRASIDNANMGFTSTAPIKSRVSGKVCAAKQTKETRVEITKDTVDQIREYVESVAPDCETSPAKEIGWFCKIPGTDPESAKQELIGVRTTMIRRWSRQPYLLARRLAVGIQIANAIQSDQPEKDLDTFCKIIKENQPQEIPIVMTSQRWQSALCTKGSEYRLDAAMFGLAKTINEVDFMRQLFEATSKLGTLTIRVPRDVSPSGQFFVQLKPDSNVNSNLAKASLNLWKTDPSGDDSQKACWHPLFTESPHFMELARNLTMAGESTKAICDADPATPATEKYVQRYLADSITSETEFVITNGRAKLLRLPIGAYSYSLQALPENPDEWDDATLSGTASNGVIDWPEKRPRPIINTWGG